MEKSIFATLAASVVLLVLGRDANGMTEAKMLRQVYWCQDKAATLRGFKRGTGVWAYTPGKDLPSRVGSVEKNDGISIFRKSENGWELTCSEPPSPPSNVTVSGKNGFFESCKEHIEIFDCLSTRFHWKRRVDQDGDALIVPPRH